MLRVVCSLPLARVQLPYNSVVSISGSNVAVYMVSIWVIGMISHCWEDAIPFHPQCASDKCNNSPPCAIDVCMCNSIIVIRASLFARILFHISHYQSHIRHDVTSERHWTGMVAMTIEVAKSDRRNHYDRPANNDPWGQPRVIVRATEIISIQLLTILNIHPELGSMMGQTFTNDVGALGRGHRAKMSLYVCPPDIGTTDKTLFMYI